MTKVMRYDWQDAITRAAAVDDLPAKVLSTTAQLATAITWEPKNGKPSGLYWENELAAEVHGIARATFYRHLKILKEHGFLKVSGGNLIATMPENTTNTTDKFYARKARLKYQYETTESQSDTSKSQSDNPFSVDLSSVDTFSASKEKLKQKERSSEQ